MSLLPSSKSDANSRQDGNIQVVGVNDDRTNEILSAISSTTAREILSEVYTEPATPSEIAEKTDGSVQNVSYHLEKLKGAGAIDVVDILYSEKGQEMKVYAPADDPIVLFVWTEERQTGLVSRLKRLVSTVGGLIVTSFVIGYVVDDSMLLGISMTAAGGESTGYPLAIGFLVGGLFTLLLIALWAGWDWYLREKSS